jgi:cyclophilin family peptidyl-prolyl cis-trans isomerase
MKKTSLLFLTIIILLTYLTGCSSIQKLPKKSYVATIYTRFGEIDLILFDDTPKHRENFIKLAEDDFYDSTTFHRVLQDFMIQGGDPNSKPNASGQVGTGSPGYTIEAELLNHYKHDKGI